MLAVRYRMSKIGEAGSLVIIFCLATLWLSSVAIIGWFNEHLICV